jgi:hypothetical protein
MYCTIFVTVGCDDYDGDYEIDRSTVNPEQKEIEFNANNIWELANKVVAAFSAHYAGSGRTIKNAYVGIQDDDGIYSKLFTIESGSFDESHPDVFIEDEYRIQEFLNVAVDGLKQWPDYISSISVTLEFSDNSERPSNEDMLEISEIADIDCEALVFDKETDQLVRQGYEMGDYETGYYSNEAQDYYLGNDEFNKDLLDLQIDKTVQKRIVQ